MTDARPVMAAVILAAVLGGCSRAPEKASDAAAEAQQSVETTTERAVETVSDAWLTTKIQAQFFADHVVRGRDIDVDTVDRIVTLTGHVDNGVQRSRAESLATQTPGVRSVRNQLQIGPATANEPASRAPRRARGGASPGWITTQVQARYFADPELRGSDVDVTTTNGVVTLLGTVPTQHAKQRAVEIARATEGVRSVDDRLRTNDQPMGTGGTGTAGSTGGVAPNTDDPRGTGRGLGDRLDDASITIRIQGRYFTDEEVRGRNIDVTTVNGEVRLKGEVGSEAERQQALLLARRTPGVTRVEDLLRVVPGAGDPAGTPIEDAWITTKIQSQYFLDTIVNGMDLDVTTRGGVVTVSGRADSAQARRRALEIARATSGVKHVDDKMTVGDAATQNRSR